MTYREKQKFTRSVSHNFDTSIVIPLEHSALGLINHLLHYNGYLQRNGIEVIIATTLKVRNQLTCLVKRLPFINWKIVKVSNNSKNTCYSALLNNAVAYATKKYVLLLSEDFSFRTDTIFYLRQLLVNYPGHYALSGIEQLEHFNDNHRSEIHVRFENTCLMVRREHLDRIGGFDETITNRELTTVHFQRRLEFVGIKELKGPEAKLKFDLERVEDLKPYNGNQNCVELERTAKFPISCKVQEQVVLDSRLVYDWQNKRFAKDMCEDFLEIFIKYEIKNEEIFSSHYKKIVLCQAYNESEHIAGFLMDMAKYFDGIILLDDGSTDNTWKLAKDKKLLLKVKKERNEFNDLENRNTLLDIASFFNAEWFCFMDIDERFDRRFCDFSSFENDPNKSVIGFHAVYLWDNEQQYYSKIPNSTDGVLKVIRMFRNIGAAQISTFKKKLHFAQTPHFNNISFEKILFKDYGILNKNKRLEKYERYKKEDKHKDYENYEYLLDDNANKNDIKEIKI